MQHGTTKVSWLDVIVTLRLLGGRQSQVEKLHRSLKLSCAAFCDCSVDWPRIPTIMQRVAPECIDALLEFKARHRFVDVPQVWFRHSWALLEPAVRLRAPKGNEAISHPAQLLYTRRLLALVEEELATNKRRGPGGGVFQIKDFNNSSRHGISQLAQKYTVGMSMAANKHTLSKDCLAAFDGRFVQGEFDSELISTTQPAVVGPEFSWVRAFKADESRKANTKQQQALDDQAAAQMQVLQSIDSLASMLGGDKASSKVNKQSRPEEAFRGALVSVAQAYHHALQNKCLEVRKEAEQACMSAECSMRDAQKNVAGQHFSLLECTRKDETHELVMCNEWHAKTAAPGVTWCDLNHMLPDDVLSGGKLCTERHLETLVKLLPSVAMQRVVVVLCPAGPAAWLIETCVQKCILLKHTEFFCPV